MPSGFGLSLLQIKAHQVLWFGRREGRPQNFNFFRSSKPATAVLTSTKGDDGWIYSLMEHCTVYNRFLTPLKVGVEVDGTIIMQMDK
jgi:hypothetical protein